ncbi:MAG TPA: hypothetical protein VEU96_11530 [Bryobacteraceae bacterium]|nr:hypothetical protein [Bryobacteraceae bacterium]
MNWKILSAFAAGAVIASGIVYVAVKPAPAPRPLTVVTAIPPPAMALTASTAQAAPAEPVAAQSSPVASAPVREKPSPMPSPAVRKATAPPPAPVAEEWHPPAPPPVTEPINKDRPYNDAKPAESYAPPQPDPPVTATVPQEPSAPEPPSRGPNRVILLAGTVLPVRIGETISSAHNQKGDTFLATLDQPLVIDGFIIAERGARVEGRVVEADAPGRGKGSSRLGIELVKLSTADGQYVKIRTEPFSKEGASNNGRDVATVAAGAAIGAAIGAAAGSGKGAAIGAGVGGAAGVADVLLTRGRPAEIPVETRISFRMAEAVTITERLN